jgi:tetratricopeptide (TPR) repeat protein
MYPEAINYYQKSLRSKPVIIDSYLKLGILNFRLGNHEKVIENITNLLAFNDTAEIAYRCRGTAYMKTDKFIEALTDFDKFLLSDSTDYDILFNKAVCHKELQQYKDAINAFKLAIKSKKDSYQSYYLSAQCKYALNDFEGASADLDSISEEYAQSYLEVYHLSAMNNTQLKNFQVAITDYTKAIEKDPENIELISERGKLYYALGENDEALKDYNNLIEIDSEISGAYYIRGVILVKLKKFTEACNDFKTADLKGYPVPESAFSICEIEY